MRSRSAVAAFAAASILCAGPAARSASLAPAAPAVARSLAVVMTTAATNTPGTAFAVRSVPGRTLFLTAAHVVGCRTGETCTTGTALAVYLQGDLRRERRGRVVKVGQPGRGTDLALFVVDEGPLPVVTLHGEARRNDVVAALGYPESTLEALRDRHVEAAADAVLTIGSVFRQDDAVVEGSFPTHPGDSGGPVFEPASGRVIGVVHGRAPGGGPYLAVASQAIERFAGSEIARDLSEFAAASPVSTAAAPAVRAAPTPPATNDAAALFAFARQVRSRDPGAYSRALRQSAEAGNGLAADALAAAYQYGEGVPRDASLSTLWFDRALVLLRRMSDAGDGAADFVLGRKAEIGIGLPLEADRPKAAMAYFRRGAERKNCDSIEILGQIYKSGGYVATDFAQAVQWYKRGAEAGCEKATYELAKSYELGRGVPKDLQAALRWYDADAKLGGYGSLDAERLRHQPGIKP